MKRRVVVTGVSAITPIGIGKDEFWKNLTAGKSGIGRITLFDPSRLNCQIAGEVKDFDFGQYGDKKEAKRMDRVTQFAVACGNMAFADSGLKLEDENPKRIGVCVGSGIGGMQTFVDVAMKYAEKGPSRISPFFIPMEIPNMPAAQIAIALGLKGPNTAIVTACATGTNCIGDALRTIQYGDADVMLAGGSEAAITEMAIAGFDNMKALSRNNEEPEKASCPFDKKEAVLLWAKARVSLSLKNWNTPKNAVPISMPKSSATAITVMPITSRLRIRAGRCRQNACLLPFLTAESRRTMSAMSMPMGHRPIAMTLMKRWPAKRFWGSCQTGAHQLQ